MKSKIFFSLFLIITLLTTGCSTVQNVLNTLENIKRLKFKLHSVNNFRLCGINLGSKGSISDFSIVDAANLVAAFANNDFPADFTLNVEAYNPNDGTGGTSQTTTTLTSFGWTMYIDNVETVNGNIPRAIEIPGTGSTTIIPLAISLDLYDFFSSKSYEGVVNLALALGGIHSSPARLKLTAVPRVSTVFGDLPMGEITVVDKEFSR